MNDLIDLNNPKTIKDLILNPRAWAEAITGFLASDKKESLASVGRLLQASLTGEFLRRLGKEIKHYREKGTIKEDFFDTPTRQKTLIDLLTFIDNDPPAEEKFRAMKSIFFKSVSADATERESLLGYQLLQIAKDFDSGDILVLMACQKLRIETEYSDTSKITNGAEGWCGLVAREIGMSADFVELHEEKLMSRRMITPRTHPDRSGFRANKTFRLTALGVDFCDYCAAFYEDPTNRESTEDAEA